MLEPEMTVERVDAITLGGGSAFGLDAAGGVQAWLREHGRGLAVGPARLILDPSEVCRFAGQVRDPRSSRHRRSPHLASDTANRKRCSSVGVAGV